jgi:three-Cys-motif partner protein
MPSARGMGISENTHWKEHYFRRLLEILMRIVKGIHAKYRAYHPWFHYVDLYAGAGAYVDDAGFPLLGSPLIALKMAHYINIPIQAYFFENDLQEYQQLVALVKEYQGKHRRYDDIQLCAGLCQAYLPHLLESWHQEDTEARRQRLGLIYADPNGLVPFALLQKAAQALPVCDVLIHGSATAHKRQYFQPKHALAFTFEEMLDTIPKKYWLVRQVYGVWQMTFLLGSNWEEMPRKLAGHGFYDRQSAEGQAIIRRMIMRREDLASTKPFTVETFSPQRARSRAPGRRRDNDDPRQGSLFPE